MGSLDFGWNNYETYLNLINNFSNTKYHFIFFSTKFKKIKKI